MSLSCPFDQLSTTITVCTFDTFGSFSPLQLLSLGSKSPGYCCTVHGSRANCLFITHYHVLCPSASVSPTTVNVQRSSVASVASSSTDTSYCPVLFTPLMLEPPSPINELDSLPCAAKFNPHPCPIQKQSTTKVPPPLFIPTKLCSINEKVIPTTPGSSYFPPFTAPN